MIPESVSHDSPYHNIDYAEEFKKLLKETPHGIKLFLELSRELQQAGEEREKDRLTVQLIKKERTLLGTDSFFYKVSWSGQSFFVKTAPGSSEFRATIAIKEKIQHFPWVEIIEPQLGYQSKDGTGYLVSRWIDLPTVLEYKKKKPEAYKAHGLEAKLTELRLAASDDVYLYFDIEDKNAFYDEARDKIILYDINRISLRR